MPLSTAASLMTDSVPVWIVTGVVLMGGWAYERSNHNEQRLSTIEAKTLRYEQDVSEIKHSIDRIEDVLIKE